MAKIQHIRAKTDDFTLNHRNFIITIKIAVFVGISMAIGILTVCFTDTKKSSEACTLTVMTIGENLIANNSRPKSIVVHDFNNDSKLDIAVANSGTNNIGIFFGQGDGTLSNQVTYSTGTDSQPSSLALGDFNNDQKMDIVVANFGAHNIGIFLGNSNGTFMNQIIYPTGSSRPLWVTIGDFDNDSRLDIVIVNYGTNDIDILLEYDNGNFTTQITLSSPYDSIPFSAITGDFNNDNNLDIAVANSGTNNIAIYLGDGNGTFSTPITSSTDIGSQPYAIVAVDFNKDSKLDIVVANYGTDSISLLSGYGNGTFSIEKTYSTGVNSKPVSISIGNFSNDNQVDIIVSNSGTNNVGIFVGYLNGTFAYQTSFPTGLDSKPYFIVGGDFNNDKRLDIAVANYGKNSIAVCLAYTSLTFSSQTTYSINDDFYPNAVVVGDFSNNGLLDIVITYRYGNNIGVFWGKGDGTFANLATYPVDYDIYSVIVAFGDFNNDNLLDLVAIFRSFNLGPVAVFLGNNDGTLSNPIIYNSSISINPMSIVTGDFNTDNRLDIVILSSEFGYDKIRVFLGNGDGTFSNNMPSVIYSDLEPKSIAVGDFNNDNRLDLVTANRLNSTSLSSSIGIFLGNGDGTFSNQTTFSTGYYALTQSVAVGDFNNDNRLDIVVANPWNDNIGIFLGLGNGTFLSQKTHSTGIGSHPVFVTVCSFNSDNRLDILVVNQNTHTITVLLGNGDATFPNQLSYSTGDGSTPSSIALGDFNSDSIMDVVFINSGNKNVGVRLGIININFASDITFSTGSSPDTVSVVVSDFNKDKRLDIVVANHITNDIAIYLENENDSFSVQQTYSTGSFSSPTSITVTDFDKDMYADIAVVNAGTDNIGVFFGYGNGTFYNQTNYPIADNSNPHSITHGDFNSDSKPDIVVANRGNSNINILINSFGGCFRDQVPYYTEYGSNPHGIVVGDINNDKILDIVVANNGKGSIGVFIGHADGTFSQQKTYFIGDDSYPVAVDLGDFNNDSRVDIVVVRNTAHEIVIFLQDDKENFFIYGSYYTGDNSWPGIAVVSDINNDTILDISVGNYRSNSIYIFIGIGDGTFSLLYTYQTGDKEGLRLLAIGDFNSDNRPDIAIANAWNDHVGILLGVGNGSFSEQNTYSLSTNSIPSAIALGDFDGDNRLDIVVANQNADNVAVLFGYGNGTFTDQIIFSTGTGSQPTSVATGDLNKDGLFDIVVAKSQTGNVGILFAYVNRTFFTEITLPTNDRFSLPRSIAVGHFNNDSLLDIAVSNGYGENIGIYLALPWTTFLTLPPYSTGVSSQPVHVATGDFNNDAKLDIAIANYGTNNVMILLGSGYGTISSQMIYNTGDNSQSCWIAIGDLNNDTRLDIAVANSGSNNVGILFGYGNGNFSNQITYSTGLQSNPTSVAIGYFNNDTYIDIAVANNGSNNVGILYGDENGSFTYKILFSAGFDSRPFALASGNMIEGNRSDIIVVNNGYSNIQILSNQC